MRGKWERYLQGALALWLGVTLAACAAPADEPGTPDSGVPAGSGAPADEGLEGAAPPGARTSSAIQMTLPYVVEGVCPGEYCRFGEWMACQEVPVFADRLEPGEAVATLSVGEKFETLTGVDVVISPHVVLITSDVTGDYGTAFQSGDSLYVLDHSSDGIWKVWYRGDIVLVTEFWSWREPSPSMNVRGHVVERGDSEFWAHIRRADGAEGWIRGSYPDVVQPDPFEPGQFACPEG